jgi:primosomal protein N' (replication factor Y)
MKGIPVLQIALPTPLYSLFDYLPPADFPSIHLQIGTRVRVPWRNGEMIGVLLNIRYESQLPYDQLKKAIAIIDNTPVISQTILELTQFAANYYQFPMGEVIATALPTLLRQGKPTQIYLKSYYQLSDIGKSVDLATLKRSPRQKLFLELMMQYPQGISETEIIAANIHRPLIKLFIKKNWIQLCLAAPKEHTLKETDINASPYTLSSEQQYAVTTVINNLNHFKAFLLDGVTGSGKTEVYLQIIAEVLSKNKQALILVPEIGLTPQTVTRFAQRFNVPIAILHSGLTDRERLQAWLMSQQGDAAIIIGTRSAIFTPIPRLGIIIVDEEHDVSFKQHEGFRYCARDLAIVRARINHVPIILGSATPSLESIYNVQQQRYQLLHLPERAGVAIHPQYHLINLRQQPIEHGLSASLLQAITRHLKQQGQVLIFINRRGFAPTLLCASCGQIAQCRSCDARMILHLSPRLLQCHHCGSSRPVDKQCIHCKASKLIPLGVGTERIEQILQNKFPDVAIIRIDRDSTRKRGELNDKLESIHNGNTRILIGTQMLAKGHHFPEVTLVAIIDADSALYSADFRGSERAAQIITQVAGRAGRAERPGEVFIQTYHPEHALLQALINEGYANFAAAALAERFQAQLPPYSYLALLRAEAKQQNLVLQYLNELRDALLAILPAHLRLLGPVPSPMARRAGHHRAQLLFRSSRRQILQDFLPNVLKNILENKMSKKIRWSLDVDPFEMF